MDVPCSLYEHSGFVCSRVGANHIKSNSNDDGHWSRENLHARDLSAVRPCAWDVHPMIVRKPRINQQWDLALMMFIWLITWESLGKGFISSETLCLRCSSDDSPTGQGLVSCETLRLWCLSDWSRENLHARDLWAVRPCAWDVHPMIISQAKD